MLRPASTVVGLIPFDGVGCAVGLVQSLVLKRSGVSNCDISVTKRFLLPYSG